mgnify:CR=1 FL=1
MKKILFLVFIVLLAVGAAAAQESAGRGYVTLRASDGVYNLSPVAGELHSVAVPMVGIRRYVEYRRNPASAVTGDRKPELVVAVDADPAEDYWLVRLQEWKDTGTLVLDIDSPSIWEGGAAGDHPDAQCNMAFASARYAQGRWSVSPRGRLAPGVYGLFRWTSKKSRLYAFEVTEKKTESASPAGDGGDLYRNITGIVLMDGRTVRGRVLGVDGDIMTIRTAGGDRKYHLFRDVRKYLY